VEIGENAEIGSHCSIYSVSTIDNKEGKVTIGKYAKIGSHSTIMPGVTIGDFAVIGAHSFVNKDVAPNVTVFGVPAKNKHLVLKRSCKQTEWRVFNNEHTSTPVCTFQILNSDFFKKLFGDNK